jgi:hypothetical protein
MADLKKYKAAIEVVFREKGDITSNEIFEILREKFKDDKTFEMPVAYNIDIQAIRKKVLGYTAYKNGKK